MGETVTYTTLRKVAEAEFTEKKSVFIGHAAPVKTVEEAEEFIASVKKDHADARHNVPAFLIRGGAIARYSDDGEPQGTAGMPVLDVIKKSGVDDACVVVTRYFGGILLGTGGLVRAYSEAAKLALQAAEIVAYRDFSVLLIALSYADHAKVQSELTKHPTIIDSTEFGSGVDLQIAVLTSAEEALIGKIMEITAGRAEIVKIGTRFDSL